MMMYIVKLHMIIVVCVSMYSSGHGVAIVVSSRDLAPIKLNTMCVFPVT